jgi:hypothetical protein
LKHLQIATSCCLPSISGCRELDRACRAPRSFRTGLRDRFRFDSGSLRQRSGMSPEVCDS